ncbi:nuclear transport factor 2 family protein [Reichenbachiella sp.]|uniref:nuclear transport factor 2 family protein n=1 Tax=Reichenbachiella sp. TaxID=2184521 RepID=UPI003BAF8849
MHSAIIDNFKNYFTQMKFDYSDALNDIYSDHVVFKDPIHEIEGVKNLKAYFDKLNDNLIEGSFQFTDESIVDNKAYLSWEMQVKLKRPKKSIVASGISVLTLEDKVVHQRDYFDAGEMFYEHIPLLGSILRSLKKKIAG